MEIVWIEITDEPELWRELGFAVDDGPGWGSCLISGVEHRLVGPADGGGDDGGVVRWGVRGPDPGPDIDGIPTTWVDSEDDRGSQGGQTGPPLSPTHPNGVFRIDHLVIHTPSTPRTAGRLEELGLEIRGQRTTNSAGTGVDMRFAWAGDTLLELAGPPTPEPDGGAAAITGIAYATADLDATVALLGSRSTTPVDAVQPGRRIAALTREAGSSVPVAFMTPHVKV